MVAESAAGSGPGPVAQSQTRPTRDEIERRIDVVRKVIAAGESEGGFHDPRLPKIDQFGELSRLIDAMAKANAGDIAGAVAAARTTDDGRGGDGTIERLAGFRGSVGDFDGANRLLAAMTRPPQQMICFQLASRAQQAGDLAAAEKFQDSAMRASPAGMGGMRRAGSPQHAPTAADVALSELNQIGGSLHQYVMIGSKEGIDADRIRILAELARVPDTDLTSLITAGSLLVDGGDRTSAAAVLDRIDHARNPVPETQKLPLLMLRAGSGRPIDEASFEWMKAQPIRFAGVHMQPATLVARAAAAAGNEKDAARFAAILLPQGRKSEAPTDEGDLMELAMLIAPGDPAAGLAVFDEVIDLATQLGDGRQPLARPGTPEQDKATRRFYVDDRLSLIARVADRELSVGLKDQAVKRLAEAETEARRRIKAEPSTTSSDAVPRILAGIGDLRLKWGDEAAAIEDFEIVIKLPSPTVANPVALPPLNDALLGKILELRLKQGRLADAVTMLDRISPAARGPSAVAVANAAVKAGDFVRAEELAAQMPNPNLQGLSVALEKPRLLLEIARAELAKKNATRAAAIATQVALMLDGAPQFGPVIPIQRSSSKKGDFLTEGRPSASSVMEDAIELLADAAGDKAAFDAVQGCKSTAVVVRAMGVRKQFKMAHAVIDRMKLGAAGRPAYAPAVAMALADVAVAELQAGDRKAFDTDAAQAAEIAHEPDQPGTYDITSLLAFALDSANDPAGAEALRIAAIRRMLSGSVSDQGIGDAESRVINDALFRRGPGSAFMLAESAPTPAFRARLLYSLTAALLRQVENGEDLPSFKLVKPAPPGSQVITSYKGKTLDEWSDALVDSGTSDVFDTCDALKRFGPAAGPAIMKQAGGPASRE